MIIEDYISKGIPALEEEHTVSQAKQYMTDFKLTHMPIVSKKGKLIGNLSLEIIKDLQGELVKDLSMEIEVFSLFNNAILFDSIKVFSDNATNVIPIIDYKEKFLGVVLQEEIIEEFATYPFIIEYGAYMTIITPIQKYSISEIANIVESNNGKILGLMITNKDDETTRITLKIRAENISSIGDTFERFGYNVSNKYFEDSKQVLLKERFQQLKKFMET